MKLHYESNHKIMRMKNQLFTQVLPNQGGRQLGRSAKRQLFLQIRKVLWKG